MGLKSFLKPTKGKLAAFAVLLVIVTIYTIYAMPCPQHFYSSDDEVKLRVQVNATVNESYWSPCGLLPAEPAMVFLWPSFAALMFLSIFSSPAGFLDAFLIIFALAVIVVLNLVYLYAIAAVITKALGKLRRVSQTPP